MTLGSLADSATLGLAAESLWDSRTAVKLLGRKGGVLIDSLRATHLC